VAGKKTRTRLPKEFATGVRKSYEGKRLKKGGVISVEHEGEGGRGNGE